MDARGLGLAVPVPQVEEWTGVRTGVKRCMTAAFANGLSDEFWRSLDPSLDDVRPDEQVLSEFPVEAMRLPLVRVDASFTGAHWGHFQTVKDEDGRLRNFAMCEPTVTATVYAKSAIQRDRMLDAYTDMLAFAFTQPMHDAFTHTLAAWPGIGIDPVLNDLSFTGEADSATLPWDTGSHVFSGGISFRLNVRFYMRDSERPPYYIREIDVHAEPHERLCGR